MHLIIIGLLPLLIFVVVTVKKGERAGIITAMIGYLFSFAYFAIFHNLYDRFSIVEGILILGLGGIALKTKDARYFKFQPTFVGILLAIFFSWYQIFDTPVLLKLIPKMAILDPRFEELAKLPEFRSQLSTVSGLAGSVFFFHAILVTYAALKLNDLGWFLTRLAIYPLLMLVTTLSFIF